MSIATVHLDGLAAWQTTANECFSVAAKVNIMTIQRVIIPNHVHDLNLQRFGHNFGTFAASKRHLPTPSDTSKVLIWLVLSGVVR